MPRFPVTIHQKEKSLLRAVLKLRIGWPHQTTQELREFSTYLEKVKSKLAAIFQELELKEGVLTAENVKNHYLGIGPDIQKITMLQLCKLAYDKYKSEIKPGSLKNYGAVLSLYINRLIKQINKKGKLMCGVHFEEFPTLTVQGIDALVGTGRSNLIATTIVIQNLDQVKKDYSREMADVLMNLCGNIICGQVAGDTARQMSDRVGRIMQDRASTTINSADTSVNYSQQLDMAIPPSVISNLSSGEFVGIVADDPGQEIPQKVFHCKVTKDMRKANLESANYKVLPEIRNVANGIVYKNYMQIKEDVADFVDAEISKIMNDPGKAHLIVKR